MPQFDNDRKLYLESFPGFKTFQTFPDNKDIKSKTNLTRQVSIDGDSYPYGDFDFSKNIIDVKVMMGLEKLNDMGAGVYMTINETDGKGRKKENITKARACYADFDDPTKPLPEFKLKPSMIVESSPGKFHVYWLSDSIPLEGFTGLQKAIIYNFGSDDKVHDLPRVLRVPGFWWCKKEPRFMTRIVEYTGLKYDYGTLVQAFPPEPVKKWSAPKYQSNIKSDEEFTGSYGASKGNRNHHVLKRIGGAHKRGLSWSDIEAEAFKEAQACSPQLTQSETRAILKSFQRYL
jgi:hypothetical protein